MKELEALRGIDVYLIDELLRGRISSKSRILDAGCGNGRNIHYLIENNFEVTGIDASTKAIHYLHERYPQINDQFIQSTLEDFSSPHQFDFIICNAVLHFAKNHDHFSKMFKSLVRLLAKDGVLFIRMTSDIGIELDQKNQNGVFHLPDGSIRYLITRRKIDELISTYSLSLLEPVKTVKVEELRSMTTIVIKK